MLADREFQRADFSIEMLGEATFEGFTCGDTWNGWRCPYFTREEAIEVLNASVSNGYSWRYDDEPGVFLVRHPHDPADSEPERFDAIRISVNGCSIEVYAIGAYSWAWEAPTS